MFLVFLKLAGDGEVLRDEIIYVGFPHSIYDPEVQPLTGFISRLRIELHILIDILYVKSWLMLILNEQSKRPLIPLLKFTCKFMVRISHHVIIFVLWT